MPDTRKPYSNEEIEGLAEVIRGKNNKYTVDVSILREELYNWLYLNSYLEPSCYSNAENEFISSAREYEGLKLTYKEKAAQFTLIAKISKELRTLISSGITKTEIGQALRTLPQYEADREKGKLPSEYINEITTKLEAVESASRRLANYNNSQLIKHRPRKNRLEQHLLELALIFVNTTGQDCDLLKLPHSDLSIFIRFCSEILAEHFDESETFPSALAKRFKRLKLRNQF
jgi:hypothetical protein